MSIAGPHLGVFVEHDEHGRPVSIVLDEDDLAAIQAAAHQETT